MLKRWLNHKGVTYKEVNIDQDLDGQKKAIELSGYSMVPLTVVVDKNGNKEVITGYNLQKLASII